MTTRFIDAAGRVALTDPLGHRKPYTSDGLNDVTAIIDPLAGQTGFSPMTPTAI